MNREEWLTQVAKGIEPWFAEFNKPLKPYKITAGWPASGAARTKKGQVLGVCYPAEWSKGNQYEIVITLAMGDGATDQLADPVEIAAVVAHELCHVADEMQHQHYKPFADLAYGIGLEGKPTSTTAGPLFKQRIAPILESLPPYPHHCLDLANNRKKQSTRMIKVQCDDCGYVARTSNKWIDDVGAPLCPCNHAPMTVL